MEKKNLLIALFLTIILFSMPTNAKFIIEMGTNYSSEEDNVDNFTFSRMDLRGFLGASLDGNGAFYFGQSIYSASREHKTTAGQTVTVSALEIGPKVSIFMGASKAIYISLAWHPFAKGERKTSAGETEDISGSSLLASFGYQLKLTKTLYLGASLNYHKYSVSKYTTSADVEVTVSEEYTTLAPMIDLSLRF
ncbi:MAG: hypothetical protein GY909_13065 [Oligoflexia bacterium]|nr:hypothetical protein [Oligoflexia bacterium]